MVICNVAKILELVVPLMDHPSETFLTTIEEDLMKLIIKYGMTVSKESGFIDTKKKIAQNYNLLPAILISVVLPTISVCNSIHLFFSGL